MGSDESHLNVSVGSDGQSHKTVSTNHNLFESHLNVSVGSDGQSHKTVSTNHNLFEEKKRQEEVLSWSLQDEYS